MMKKHFDLNHVYTAIVVITVFFVLVSCGGGGGGGDGSSGGTGGIEPSLVNQPSTDDFITEAVGSMGEDECIEAILLALEKGNSLSQIVDAIMNGQLTVSGDIRSYSSSPLGWETLVLEWLKQKSKQALGQHSLIVLIKLISAGYTAEQLYDASLNDYLIEEDSRGIGIFKNKQNDEVRPEGEPQDNSISDINNPPIAHSQLIIIKTNDGNEQEIKLVGTDIEEGRLYFEIKSNPTDGSLVQSAKFADNGEVGYFPIHGFNGFDSFTFIVYEDATFIESREATVTIQVGTIPDQANYKGEGETINSNAELSCKSRSKWSIRLNPSGTLNGEYENIKPAVPNTYIGVCEDYNTSATDEWRISFSGSHKDGNFEITSFGYYDRTSRPFIYFNTKIVGKYDDKFIYSRPNYSETDGNFTIGHSFNLPKMSLP